MANNLGLFSFDKVCRTCLGKNGVSNCLFRPEMIDGKPIKLNEILSMCTEILITRKDGLPSNICDECAGQLKISYSFNQKALKAQYILKKFNNNLQNSLSSTVKLELGTDKIKIESDELKTSNKDAKKDTTQKREIRILPKSSVEKIQGKPVILYNPQRNLKITQNPQMLLLSNDMNSSNTLDQSAFGTEVTLAKLQGKSVQLHEAFQGSQLPGMILYPCLMCAKQFVSTECLESHMKHFHLEIKPSTNCSVCNVKFDSAEQLTSHNLEVHFPSLPYSKFVCDICKKEYKNKYLLARHQKMLHSEDAGQKFSCDKCKKTYSTPGGLLTHKKTRCCAHAVCQPKPQEVFCRLCERTFGSARNLAQHMKCHSGLACRYCARGYSSESELRLHSEIHAGQKKPFSCPYCTKVFSAKKASLRHQRLRHGVTRELLLCGYCGPGDFGFLGPAGLANHMKIHHPNQLPNEELQTITLQRPSEAADEDGKYIITYYISGEPNLAEGAEVDPDGNDQQQTWVSKIGDTSQFLDSITWDDVEQPQVHDTNSAEQTEVDQEKTVFEEESCFLSVEEVPNVAVTVDAEQQGDRVFIQVNAETGRVTYTDIQGTEINTAEPSAVQSQEEKLLPILDPLQPGSLIGFSCHICGEKFLRGHILRRHLFKKHNIRYNRTISLSKLKLRDESGQDPKAPYSCHVCDKKFLRLVNLEKHASRHRAGPPQCPRCGLNCENRQELTTHLQKCRTADKLACPTCGKKLTTPGGLRYHLKTHSAFRHFPCPTCGRRFLTASNLRAHDRVVHSGVRPHACTTCGRRFATADHLRKHQAGHHGQRNYLCNICGQGFLQSSHVAQHMWIHTGIKPHHCPHCPNKYTAKCSLTKHLRRNHWELQRQKHIAEERIYSKLCGEDDNESNLENSGSVTCNDITIHHSDAILDETNDINNQNLEDGLQMEAEGLSLDVEQLSGADIVMEEIEGTDLVEGVSVVIVGSCIDQEDINLIDESVQEYELE